MICITICSQHWHWIWSIILRYLLPFPSLIRSPPLSLWSSNFWNLLKIVFVLLLHFYSTLMCCDIRQSPPQHPPSTMPWPWHFCPNYGASCSIALHRICQNLTVECVSFFCKSDWWICAMWNRNHGRGFVFDGNILVLNNFIHNRYDTSTTVFVEWTDDWLSAEGFLYYSICCGVGVVVGLDVAFQFISIFGNFFLYFSICNIFLYPVWS